MTMAYSAGFSSPETWAEAVSFAVFSVQEKVARMAKEQMVSRSRNGLISKNFKKN
jgi:hypothetical protein